MNFIESVAMRDIIQKVIAAEAEAKHILEKAREESDGILTHAQRQAQELTDRVRREARLEGEQMLAAAAQEAEREKQECLARGAAEIVTQVRLEEALMQRAVRAVVRSVCGLR
jgi:vacuolar-type H+-ATPase subunit H